MCVFLDATQQVSVLKASEDMDQSAWIDNILEQAGGFGRVPERRGSRAEVRGLSC